MKKTTNSWKLLGLLLLLISSKAYSQNQLKKWYLGKYEVDLQSQTSPPFISKTSPFGSSLRGSNGIYDLNGNLEFYVNDATIFDANGNIKGNLPNPLASGNLGYEKNEIAIVPFKSNCSYSRRYYLFFSHAKSNIEVGLFGKIIQISGLNTFAITDLNNGNALADLSLTNAEKSAYIGGADFLNSAAIAVSNETNGIRNLYWIAGFNKTMVNTYPSYPGKIMKLQISEITSSRPEGISAATKLNIQYGNSFRCFAAAELDISDDGKKLAWGARINYPSNTYYSVIDISSGDYNNVNWNFTIPNGTFMSQGVEFDKTGNILYVSTGGSSGGTGIYKRNLLNSTSTFITGSAPYSSSQLERSYNDNNIYAANATSIKAIDVTNNQMSSTFSFTFPSGAGPSVSTVGMALLPDQIDGCNYDNYLNIPSTFDAINFTTTTGANWTATGNPINSSGTPIQIQNQLNFTAPGVYNITDMEFQFGKDAIMNIESGVTVNLINTKLRAVECGVMWQGVTVKGGGTLNMNSSATPTTTIKSFINDAYAGITSTTNNVNIKVENTQFDANEKHIKIVDGPGSPNITVQNNQFYHLTPLRDQTRGVFYYTWNKNFGKTSIEITNTTSTLLSPTTKINNNIFDRGIYGVTITKSSVLVQENTFRNTNELCIENTPSFTGYKDKAVSVNANMMGSKNNLIVKTNTFFDVNRALVMAYQGNLTFNNSNNVGFTNFNALEVYGNKDCDIKIQNNSFSNCKNNAIMLSKNAGTQSSNLNLNESKIRITSNTIQDQNNATGITILEDAPTITPTYRELFISGNTVNNLAYGVKAFNIVGIQENNSKLTSKPSLNINEITSNAINYFATLTPNRQISDYNSGIQMLRSRGLAALSNNINSNLNTVWRNRGINCENTNYTLIRENIIKAGRGVSAILDASGNNYLCNSLNDNVYGISLGDHWMRGSTKEHGILTKESRDNNFVNSISGFNQELYINGLAGLTNTQLKSRLQGWISSNQWVFSQLAGSTALPKMEIDPNPNVPFGNPINFEHINYIYRGQAPTICGNGSFNGDSEGVLNESNQNLASGYFNFQNSYETELENKKNGGVVINSFINNLIEIENAFGSGEYLLADSLLNITSDTTAFGQNFIKVYSLLLPFRYPVITPLDSTTIDSLNTIAVQNPQTAGPAVYAARTILWKEANMQFIDNEKDHEPGLTAKINFNDCMPVLPDDLSVQLTDADNNIYNTPVQLFSDGTIYIAHEEIALLEQGLQYSFLLNYPANSVTQSLNEWIYGEINTINLCAMGKTSNIENNIGKEAKNNIVGFYPNPANNNLKFNLASDDNYQIEIVDIIGKVCIVGKVNKNNNELNLETLNGGMYLVKIKDNNGTTVLTNKLLVDR